MLLYITILMQSIYSRIYYKGQWCIKWTACARNSCTMSNNTMSILSGALRPHALVNLRPPTRCAAKFSGGLQQFNWHINFVVKLRICCWMLCLLIIESLLIMTGLRRLKPRSHRGAKTFAMPSLTIVKTRGHSAQPGRFVHSTSILYTQYTAVFRVDKMAFDIDIALILNIVNLTS